MKRMLSFLSCLALSLLVMSAVSPSSLADGGVLSKRRPTIGVPYEPLTTDVYSWTGLYAGAGVGVYAGLAGLKGEEDGGYPLFNLDRISSWGFLGDVRLGYDYHLQGSPLLVGVFGGYTWGSAEAGIDIPRFTGSASLTPTWNLGGRVGLVSGRTLFYAGYKYSQADLEVSSVGSPPVSKGLSLRGHTALGGIEYAMTKALTVGLEYGYTRYQDVDMNVSRVDIHAEPEAHAVMLRGNLRFGVGQ